MQVPLSPLRIAFWAVLALAWLVCPAPASAAVDAAYREKVGALFKTWVETLRTEAVAAGIDEDVFDDAFDGVTLDWRLPDLKPPKIDGEGEEEPVTPPADDRQQPEFDQPVKYFPERTLNNLVEAGRKRLARYADTLERIEETYGVQGEILLALWARETSYGRVDIPHYAIRALSTQAFMGRRDTFFRKELLAALEILQGGHVTRANLRSSWAGAMGHTQMLPSEFHEYSVDFDGDGKRDIWTSVPDAMAATARNLQDNGWRAGETWGYEIDVPQDFDCTLEGPDKGKPISEWVELGVKRTFDREFPEQRLTETGFLLMPAGRNGPAFIALENFYVLKTYNTSDLYALYIGHLADRLLNNRRFANRWHSVNTFRRSNVRDMQERLVARGMDVGGVDGLIGFKTRVAVGLYEKSAGLAPTCYPTPEIMDRIREEDEKAGQ